MKGLLITLLILTPITFVLYYSNFGAIGAVLDTRKEVVVVSISLLILSLFALIKKRKKIYMGFTVLTLIITVLSVKEYFFTYDEKEVMFENEGNQLYGTLYQPKSQEARCLVVFIHGSGSEDRGEYAFHARNLARSGVAAFAYDKRGSGRSEGDTYETGYQGYAGDAVAAIEKIRKTYPFEKTGLFAFSEGEWVSLIIDSLIPVDFIVMVSPSGTSPLKQTVREMTYRLERKGFTENEIEEAKNLYTDILTFKNDPAARKLIEERIAVLRDKDWFKAGEEFSEELYFYPWWNQVMYFQPETYLEASHTEILVISGRENESFPPEETVKNFQKYKGVETVILEEGDHAMLTWPLGKGVPPPFYADQYENTYLSWIHDKCKED
ncbi:alpha/beta hydrolase [Robertkochia aurantiaca]|uniref:alpha/beta hydrolase n=1 Tax=Robertkochia aurantiaca TaxID=2873700 RepID=UPI001CCCF20A|nr:alpha/beta hydrolase [Robertkochia sp. 3YJGBD-33]